MIPGMSQAVSARFMLMMKAGQRIASADSRQAVAEQTADNDGKD
jgi:hypothetical protein